MCGVGASIWAGGGGGEIVLQLVLQAGQSVCALQSSYKRHLTLFPFNHSVVLKLCCEYLMIIASLALHVVFACLLSRFVSAFWRAVSSSVLTYVFEILNLLRYSRDLNLCEPI